MTHDALHCGVEVRDDGGKMKLKELLKKKSEYSVMEARSFDSGRAFRYGEIAAKQAKVSPDTDLYALVKANGGTVHEVTFSTFLELHTPEDIFEKSIYVHEGGESFDIVLPASATYVENRYTIAHELGHYILHSGSGKCFAQRKEIHDSVEEQADCFALGFLMPKEDFQKAYDEVRELSEAQRVLRLASIFSVPEYAVRMRIGSIPNL